MHNRAARVIRRFPGGVSEPDVADGVEGPPTPSSLPVRRVTLAESP